MTIHQTQLARQAQHYSSVRLRLLGEPKRVMRKVEILPTETASRFKKTILEQQNEFIKLRCIMLKTSHKDITAEHMSMRTLAIRDQILLEVKERWRHIRAKRLAELFHRSEKGVLAITAKLRAASAARPITTEAAEEMRRLRSEGMKISKIGEKFGVAENTVRYHLGKKEKA